MRRFYFRLALALGMTVGELLGRITSRELSEWMAYYELEPFGQERGDLQAGVVASVMANAWKGKGTARKFTPGDFVLRFGEEGRERVREPRKIYQAFREWAMGFKEESG